MKIILTETQYKRLRETIDDLYDKINRGEKLTPHDEIKLKRFSKHVEKGGDESDFTNYNIDTDPNEGITFDYDLNGKTFKFKFSEITTNKDEIELSGTISYDDNTYYGVIAVDKSGYLIDFDFYNINDENIKLQDILKKEGTYFEIEYFLVEEVIPKIL